MTDSEPYLSVVVPVRNGEETLRACLEAIRRSTFQDFELIVVDDGSVDTSQSIAHEFGANVVECPSLRSAAARNAGARKARGEVLVFVDADCEIHDDALALLAARFRTDSIDAAFGSYDDTPAADGIVSVWKNLQHHYVHQHSRRDASTFWTGCGAVRTAVFLEVEGFDAERHPGPSVEDVAFGRRLRAGGHSIALMPDVLAKHHKRWTLSSFVRTDLFSRAIPWSRLMLSRSGMTHDLNLDWRGRSSGIAVGAMTLAALLTIWFHAFGAVALLALACFVAINAGFYRFLASRQGALFAVAGIGLHVIHFAIADSGFLLGALLAARDRLTVSRDDDGRAIPLVSRLTATPVLQITGISFAILLALMQIARSGNFVDLVPYQPGDDWAIYRTNAVSILHDGITMPRIGNYRTPSGFLYNYFIAAVFALFGENSNYVYVIQALLLGLSITLLASAFRSRIGAGPTLCASLMLVTIAVLDVFHYYTNLLISENLMFVLMPVVLLSAIRAVESLRPRDALGAGLLAGVASLARPNALLIAPAVMFLLWRRAPRMRHWLRLIAFAFGFGVIVSIFVARNMVSSGRPSVSIVTNAVHWIKAPEAGHPVAVKRHKKSKWQIALIQYARHTAFIAGFPNLVNGDFRPRPHWWVLWAGVLGLAVLRMARGDTEWWERVAFAFAIAYAIPIVIVPRIDTYGFRLVIPILGVASILCARGVGLIAEALSPATAVSPPVTDTIT
jgi:GT2 family glycosyltransferase